jgi:hypothetical protein
MARVTSEAARLRIGLANEVSWDDLRAVAGAARCHDDLCFCQRFKILTAQWRSVPDEERAHRVRTQAECGQITWVNFRWAAGTLSPRPGSGK